MAKPRSWKFILFSLIGIFNTLFDIALYVILYNLSHSIVLANLVATSAALIGSYLLNARVTFKTKQWTLANFVGFVTVTVFGLWVLQTVTIYLLTPLVSHIPETVWQFFGGLEGTLKTVTPKLLATVVTFIWNFIWYNKVIFRTQSPKEQAIIALKEL